MDKIKNESHFKELCNWCSGIEPKLEAVIREYDYPPLWYRKPDFATLILTILEQQVSLASAKAAYIKLVEKIKAVTPENLLKLSDEELRACSFSRQKIKYSRILAAEIASGNLNLDELKILDEPAIREKLIQLKGIGNWTVDMYVLMSLHFSDIFPPGDLATIKAVYELELVPAEATKDDIISYMKRFSPNRSVASYILWHYYIQKRQLILE
ncbi:DNA-3-methyladenine glycosylase family protein [Draconibacterium halophilum]|uniref:DNA-3-methyladenine glycosylase II n=1 Tax=Draconibacterium halophilum TaxID=2706887 RepID=A0A6C0RJT3_9BACT|nr:DNA-3-methyladenine glycosylase 2 family protein [Draconibacterium halophilum]QIA09481.1 DNA-3-methyladenine glycosylase 2 family protein [Draconibacterium halophilum]